MVKRPLTRIANSARPGCPASPRFLAIERNPLPSPRDPRGAEISYVRLNPLAGQTSWSKALVRHGADARVALAGVLGVLAGDIRLRDCSE